MRALSTHYVTSLVTSKSCVMMLNSSNNPTGSVLFYGEVAALLKIAVERDLIVISDEVYERNSVRWCQALLPRDVSKDA